MNEPRFLSPEALARVRGLQLRTRKVVDGLLQGIHRSPHHGSSIEFSEHKEYAPGDDLRHIDWKAYGRLDKYTVKRFEQESNLRAHFIVDASGSMGYGHDGALTKYEYGAVLAVGLGYVLVGQQDAVGLAVCADGVRSYVASRARYSHINNLCQALEEVTPEGGTQLASAFDAIGERSQKRGLAFLFSDLLGDMSATFEAMSHLVGRGHSVTVFHLLDPDELTFPFQEMTLFLGMESSRRLLVEPRVIRRAYLKRLEAHRAEMRTRCLQRRIDYVFVDTSSSPEEVLLEFITGRKYASGHARMRGI